MLCRSCAIEISCRSSSVYRLYHVLSCINDRTQYSWAMAAHHTSDDQPKGDAYGTGGGPVHRRPRDAGSRVAITITVILRDGCSRHAHVNGGDDAAVKPRA